MGNVTRSLDRSGCEWLQYDYRSALMTPDRPGSFSMWRYRKLLPVAGGPVRYPLPIGGTPLLPAPALRKTLGTPRLWIKDETRNPTASNKDRATALVIEDGLRRGMDTITTASTGNAAVATAFGAAAAGMRAVIFVSADCRPEKLALMAQAGAWVFQVRDGYAAAVDLSRAAARSFGWLDRNTGANPLTIEAKKTVAFEVWEQLGRRLPDLMILPVGDGPTLVALDKGFTELVNCGLTTRKPRLIGIQAEHCQPLVRAWQDTPAKPADLDPTATVADGIAVLRPAIGEAALTVTRQSGGAMMAVTDTALLSAVSTLADTAGVNAEPAGAAALAGLNSAIAHGLADPSESVVLLVTGRETKASGEPAEQGRVTLIDTLDQVEHALTESH
ncbi:pyridoxal-phosphate dependent enzyme [Streptomyces sp. NBC_01619]|uniref:pyridoxal-phosphate dependent enzyme n=1 Tax=Streptomyces sp. NBC_01619 TaxID=2975901 RepID=UPI00224EC4E9|nr:pyridoxal-phosphate dependent enzyme [Streptomyces sp. NBC_01619]MCX4515674.1 pyridoxal-phosphate dependent enzyme [Streptomyces sp. NBC_01619]